MFFSFMLGWIAKLATGVFRRSNILSRGAAISTFKTGPVVRSLYLGCLAGGIPYIGCICFVLLHAIAFQFGRFVYLGGQSMVMNGVAQSTLPDYLWEFGICFAFSWGLFLAEFLGEDRPAWWKVAPLMWISIAIWIAAIAVFTKVLHTNAAWYIALIPYSIFDMLFGGVMHSIKSALVLFIGCPLAYLLAIIVVAGMPLVIILDCIFPDQTSYSFHMRSTITYQLSLISLQQTLTAMFQGALTGMLVYGIYRGGEGLRWQCTQFAPPLSAEILSPWAYFLPQEKTRRTAGCGGRAQTTAARPLIPGPSPHGRRGCNLRFGSNPEFQTQTLLPDGGT